MISLLQDEMITLPAFTVAFLLKTWGVWFNLGTKLQMEP